MTKEIIEEEQQQTHSTDKYKQQNTNRIKIEKKTVHWPVGQQTQAQKLMNIKEKKKKSDNFLHLLCSLKTLIDRK